MKDLEKIENDIKYLMTASKCSRVDAVFALMANGRIRGRFNAIDTSKLLGISTALVKQAYKSGMYKVSRTIKEENLELKLKEFLQG